MNIGVLKETKTDESRVALMPHHCRQLISNNHKVYVQSGSGVKIGITDDEYLKSGAGIVHNPLDIISTCDLIVCVKSPPIEYIDALNSSKILFTYLHLDENQPVEYAEKLRKSGVTSIAYEWVQDEGKFPLLEPMSKITGALFAFKAAELLLSKRGIIPFYYESSAPSVMIFGYGTIGSEAARIFANLGWKITIVHKDYKKVQEFLHETKADFVHFDMDNIGESIKNIRESLPEHDVFLCSAVRREDLSVEKYPHVIDKKTVSNMKPGSVVMDATANIRDLVETCVPHEELNATYEVDGVIHYNPDHIPALAGLTSSKILTDATFPFISLLARDGISALHSKRLRSGLMTYNGLYYHEYTCTKKKLPLSTSLILPHAE